MFFYNKPIPLSSPVRLCEIMKLYVILTAIKLHTHAHTCAQACQVLDHEMLIDKHWIFSWSCWDWMRLCSCCLTCSSWCGLPPGSGPHSGSEPCCRSWPAPRSPSLHLNTEPEWAAALHHLWSMGLCGKLTWLLVQGVPQKEKDHTNGNDGRPPGQEEHDHHTDHGDQQRQPLTVEPEGRTPACKQKTNTVVTTLQLSSQTSNWPPGGWRLSDWPRPRSLSLPDSKPRNNQQAGQESQKTSRTPAGCSGPYKTQIQNVCIRRLQKEQCLENNSTRLKVIH